MICEKCNAIEIDNDMLFSYCKSCFDKFVENLDNEFEERNDLNGMD